VPPKNIQNPGAELLRNFAAHLEVSTKAHECAQQQPLPGTTSDDEKENQ
jgi:hypothetical protein